MSKKFTASGVLYKDGDTIGMTDKSLSDELMQKVVIKSPVKMPVLSEIHKAFSGDPDYVIGNASLVYQPATTDPSRITCHVDFNETHRKEYEKILNGRKTREKLRFGFLLSDVKKDKDGNICDGRITAVSLSTTGLGGQVFCYGWEDE